MILNTKIFYFLIFITVVIFISTVLLGVYTLFLRYVNRLKGKKWSELEVKWEPILLQTLSGSIQPEMLWNLVKEKEHLYFVDYIQRYAQRMRGTERDILHDIASPFIGLVAEQAKTGDPEQRARAIQTLSLLGMPEYADQIIEALDDSSPLVAMIAARYLMRPDHPEYCEQVIKRLHRFTSWSRNLLSSMLARVGSSAVPSLRETFSNTENPILIRAIAGDALLQLNDFESADLAVRILELESDRELLASCLRIVSRVGRPDHITTVIPLCSSSDFVVRAHAFRALGRLASHQEMNLLRHAFDDSSSWVAIQAAEGLREGGNLDMLRDIASSDHPKSDLAKQILAEEMR